MNKPLHINRGFSLLELMAVILIIGLGLGAIGLSTSRAGPEAKLVEEIERFLDMTKFAGEAAILTGETMGLILEPPSWRVGRGEDEDELGWRYRWMASSSQGWQEIPTLKPIVLPPEVELVVEVDGLIWEYDSQVDRTTPVAAVYSSGDITELRIEMNVRDFDGFSQTIEVNENGELVWLEAPERPEDEEEF